MARASSSSSLELKRVCPSALAEYTCACERRYVDVGELGVDGDECDEIVDGDDSADGVSDPDETLRFNFERPRTRNLLGKASPTRFDRRVERLDVERVLPWKILYQLPDKYDTTLNPPSRNS